MIKPSSIFQVLAPRAFSRVPVLLRCLPLLLAAACATQHPDAGVPAGNAAPAPAQRIPDTVAAVPAVPSKEALALRDWVEQQDRVYRVAAPLLLQNTALCKKQARDLLGLTARTKYSYSSRFADAAQAALGLDERLRVMNVMPGSGAEQSGIRRGDVLLSVDGKNLPQGPDAERGAGRLIAAAMQGRSSVRLGLARQGQQLAVDVPLTRACAIAVELGSADNVNSYADGLRVAITRGMLGQARSDEELAYVLAKEIAHAVMAYSPKPNMSAAIDALLARAPDETAPFSASGIKAYSPVADATADKLSLYMLARAGYDVDNAPAFWRRIASQYSPAMRNDYTWLHPATDYRFSVMTVVLRTVKDKKAHGWPLVP